MLRSDELKKADESRLVLSDLRRLIREDAQLDGPIAKEKRFLRSKFARPEQRAQFYWAYVKLVFYVNRTQNLRRLLD